MKGARQSCSTPAQQSKGHLYVPTLALQFIDLAGEPTRGRPRLTRAQ